MKIIFHLLWMKKGTLPRKGFKSAEAAAMLEDYISRIAKFVPCEVQGRPATDNLDGGSKAVWWCDRGPRARVLSSEDTARHLERCANGGLKELRIFVGGPDGFGPDEERCYPPDLRWSFGALTLPHELAAVVASEQVYRAWTILKGLPYHGGH